MAAKDDANHDEATIAAREEQKRKMREALDKKSARSHAGASARMRDGSEKSHGKQGGGPATGATHRKTGAS